MNKVVITKQRVGIFKHAIDFATTVAMWCRTMCPPYALPQFCLRKHILLLFEDSNVMGVAEAQLFDLVLVHVAKTLTNKGKRVIVDGLDMDFKGNSFGSIPLVGEHYQIFYQDICHLCEMRRRGVLLA